MERFLSENAWLDKKVVFYGDGLTADTQQVSAGTSHPARSQNPAAPIALGPGAQSQRCVQGTASPGLPNSWVQDAPGSLTSMLSAWPCGLSRCRSIQLPFSLPQRLIQRGAWQHWLSPAPGYLAKEVHMGALIPSLRPVCCLGS